MQTIFFKGIKDALRIANLMKIIIMSNIGHTLVYTLSWSLSHQILRKISLWNYYYNNVNILKRFVLPLITVDMTGGRPIATPFHHHQIRHWFFETIFESVRQLNASRNSSKLDNAPLTRKRCGACLSINFLCNSSNVFVAQRVCNRIEWMLTNGKYEKFCSFEWNAYMSKRHKKQLIVRKVIEAR